MTLSCALGAAAKTAQQRKIGNTATLKGWKTWKEPTMAKDVPAGVYPAASVFTNSTPLEMTTITKALTTFAYYETTLGDGMLASTGPNALSIPTYQATAISAYLDGVFVGSANDHSHGSGSELTLDIAFTGAAGSTLTLVVEELGYANYGFKTQLKKGPSTAPSLNGKQLGGTWKMRGGLAGEHLHVWNASSAPWATPTATDAAKPGTWFQTTFSTPPGVSDAPDGQQLFFHAQGFNRGRIWVNSHEVGRYWMLVRNKAVECPNGEASCPTQQYYHIPAAWLNPTGTSTITVFETLGAPDYSKGALAVSSMTQGTQQPNVDLTTVQTCAF